MQIPKLRTLEIICCTFRDPETRTMLAISPSIAMGLHFCQREIIAITVWHRSQASTTRLHPAEDFSALAAFGWTKKSGALNFFPSKLRVCPVQDSVPSPGTVSLSRRPQN